MAAGVLTERIQNTSVWPSVGKHRRVQLAPQFRLQFFMNKTRFLLSPADIRELYFHPSASGCSLVCVLLSLSIIVSARCLFPLASVLSYLTLNHTQIDRLNHRQIDIQTHKPQKQTESRHLHSQHHVLKKVNWLQLLQAAVKELCRKGIMTLNLVRGQLNQTGIF